MEETFWSKSVESLHKYVIEIIFITLALAIGATSFFLFYQQNENIKHINSKEQPQEDKKETLPELVAVDLSGAVVRPDVYHIKKGMRIGEIIKLAGGISDDADGAFFRRNFNLASYVGDQEKIYVPFKDEILNGTFFEKQRSLDYTGSQTNTVQISENTDDKISINSSSIDELDTLVNVGKATAEKIIQNRPYDKVTDLIDKKIIKQNVFDGIKNQITI